MFVTTKHMAWDLCFVPEQNTNQKVLFLCFKYELQVQIGVQSTYIIMKTYCLLRNISLPKLSGYLW